MANRLRGWLENRSTVVRIVLLIGFIVLFRMVQIGAEYAQGIGRENTLPFVVVGLVVAVAAVITLYSIFALLWSFVQQARGRRAAGEP